MSAAPTEGGHFEIELAELNARIATAYRTMTSFLPDPRRKAALQDLVRLERQREDFYGVPPQNAVLGQNCSGYERLLPGEFLK